jgi:outer membrane receptor protein involved in Fe transport
MKKQRMNSKLAILIALPMIIFGTTSMAADGEGNKESNITYKDEITVTAKRVAPAIQLEPEKTTIDIGSFQSVGPETSVIDVLQTYPAIDFRGETSLDPGVDSIFLRGFDSKRFVTAIDGLTVQRTGGRKSSNIVDYGALPTFLFDRIEILPGPHTALFDSRAIGGVINMKMKRPEAKEGFKPDVTFSSSYSAYDTMQNVLSARGALHNLTYDAGYRLYSTDGYLRHSETEIETTYGRLGYLFPGDGFVALSASKTETYRDVAVNNPGLSFGDYDDDYPDVDGSAFDAYQDPTWDGDSYNYRLDFNQPTPYGTITFNAYSGKDNRKRLYYETVGATELSSMDTDWWQKGGKLQDEYTWSNNQVTTFGYDMVWLSDNGGVNDEKIERVKKQAGFAQHKFTIAGMIDMTLGIRHEDVSTTTFNNLDGKFYIPGRGYYIDRDFSAWVPKSLTTWRMDHLSPAFRDTSLSLGISRIWRAPDYHGDYNPQGRPTGAWVEPEDGIGYDLIFNRRLAGDIQLKSNFSFYDIENYIASNQAFSKYSGGNAGSSRFSDYQINLEEVYRYGFDLELRGHIIDALSFYLAYSWQNFENQGDEPAGQEELDQRAEHRVKAGLRYSPLERTTFMIDYQYQSDEVTEVSEEIADDVWNFREVQIDAYQTVDVAVEQILFQQKGILRDMKLKLYIQNLFDETYCDTSGYPATDMTFGANLSLRF